MNIGLVGAVECGVNGNPGWHMITAGIRWLVRQVNPHASFLPINMHAFDVSWEAARTCETVIVCGNPRFSMSLGDAFWEHDMWERLSALTQFGVKVIDGWAGAGFPYTEQSLTADEIAVALSFLPKRQDYLQIARSFHGRITRDAAMQSVYAKAGISSTLLPCSSWWAQQEYHVGVRDTQCDALVLFRSRHTGWFLDALKTVIERGFSTRPLRVIATTWDDYQWAQEVGLTPTLITDPPSLLQFYGTAGNVLSFRLHGAIPAASMGCAVTAVAIDSRVYACNQFEIPIVRFTDLPALPAFAPCVAPSTSMVVHELAKML